MTLKSIPYVGLEKLPINGSAAMDTSARMRGRGRAQVLLGIKDPNEILTMFDYLEQYLLAMILHQNFLDATWADKHEKRPIRYHGIDRDRIERRSARVDSILFFLQVTVSNADHIQDVTIGEEEELLTLERICYLLGWDDPDAIETAFLDKIEEMLLLHNELVRRLSVCDGTITWDQIDPVNT